jgi:hypothetical protein
VPIVTGETGWLFFQSCYVSIIVDLVEVLKRHGSLFFSIAIISLTPSLPHTPHHTYPLLLTSRFCLSPPFGFVCLFPFSFPTLFPLCITSIHHAAMKGLNHRLGDNYPRLPLFLKTFSLPLSSLLLSSVFSTSGAQVCVCLSYSYDVVSPFFLFLLFTS